MSHGITRRMAKLTLELVHGEKGPAQLADEYGITKAAVLRSADRVLSEFGYPTYRWGKDEWKPTLEVVQMLRDNPMELSFKMRVLLDPMFPERNDPDTPVGFYYLEMLKR